MNIITEIKNVKVIMTKLHINGIKLRQVCFIKWLYS